MSKMIMQDGILWMQTPEGGMPIMTKGGRCPYCGDKHTHGVGIGHRLAHCNVEQSYGHEPGSKRVLKSQKRPVTIRSPWGKWLDKSDGYYWIDCKANDMGEMFQRITETLCDDAERNLSNLLANLNIQRE